MTYRSRRTNYCKPSSLENGRTNKTWSLKSYSASCQSKICGSTTQSKYSIFRFATWPFWTRSREWSKKSGKSRGQVKWNYSPILMILSFWSPTAWAIINLSICLITSKRSFCRASQAVPSPRQLLTCHLSPRVLKEVSTITKTQILISSPSKLIESLRTLLKTMIKDLETLDSSKEATSQPSSTVMKTN